MNKRKIRKSLKTRRRKQRGRGLMMSKPVSINAPLITPSDGTILPKDILFQDADVCILKPSVKKGILVFTMYKQPVGMSSLCEAGLKTGKRLRNEGLSFIGSNLPGRKIHPYTFFRAPFESTEIDYTSVDDEIKSTFGEFAIDDPGRVWIRVDPAKTYVYSSEIRAIKAGSSDIEEEVNKSRMKMTDFLHQLTENIQRAPPDHKLVYHLHNYKADSIPIGERVNYPFNEYLSAEVLVRVPHLTSNYFVKCTATEPYALISAPVLSSAPVSSSASAPVSSSASAPALTSAPALAPYTLQWCNSNGVIRGKCELCGDYLGTYTDTFYHKLGCPRIRTQPDLSNKPVTTEGLMPCI